MNKIQKVLKVGDQVFAASNGKPMRVIGINTVGFITEEGFFSYDEHRKLYFLTKCGFLQAKERKQGQ
jgi:hypothetical protein